jgi:APA family basic amino acid/polyamine antiporter
VKLRREIGLFGLTLYGIGVIVGAGIYSLIGVGAGLAGGMVWLAFLVSAVLALFTALSYAELSAMVPMEAAEYHYMRKAGAGEGLSFIVGWVLAASSVLFSVTVALAFSGYLSALTGIDGRLIAPSVLLLSGALNYAGIRVSSLYNDFCAIVSVLGLLIIAALALMSGGAHTDLFLMPEAGPAGLVAAVAVIFFAYIGFENIANISEEARDSRSSVPKAILLSLGISAVLYMVVSLSALSLATPAELASSEAPLALVASKSFIDLSPALSLIALFATSNTVLIALIAASRIIYGMSESSSLPSVFSAVGRSGTPWLSVAVTAISAMLVSVFVDLRTAAELTNAGVFMAFLAVNASLIALSGNAAARPFMSPRVAGVPVLAWLGALSSALMLAYIGLEFWLEMLAVIGLGAMVYFIFKTSRQAPGPAERR